MKISKNDKINLFGIVLFIIIGFITLVLSAKYVV